MCVIDETDYESSPNTNETDYHHFQPHVRSGHRSGYRDRAKFRPNSFGNVIRQSERDQFDYSDDRNRESDGSFYDNKFSGHHKMHG